MRRLRFFFLRDVRRLRCGAEFGFCDEFFFGSISADFYVFVALSELSDSRRLSDCVLYD